MMRTPDDRPLDPEEAVRVALQTLVEASRSAPARAPFLLIPSGLSHSLLLNHPGLRGDAFLYPADMREMERRGWIEISRVAGGLKELEVTPRGIRSYETIQREAGHPSTRMNDLVHRLVDDAALQHDFAAAYRSWCIAEKSLWQAEGTSALTEIGHHCREAMQHFASALVRTFSPAHVEQNPQKVVKRVSDVLELRARHIGSTELEMLKALLGYWATLTELVMRQEHGAQREAEQLTWEDGRRVVLHTVLAMSEIARAVNR